MKTKVYNVKIENVEIIEKHVYKVKDFNLKEFNFTLSTQTVIKHDSKLVIVFVNAEIKSKPDNEPLAAITIGIGFMVENFEEEFIKNGKKIDEINTDLEKQFRAISISTLRGVMFSEFRGTRLHGAVLPIILPDDLKPTTEKKF